MSLAWGAAASPQPSLRDWMALYKPRLSAMVLLTCGCGLWVAPGSLGAWRASTTLLATAVLVAAANGLNSYLERDSDALMRRTCTRPLPAGRLAPPRALWSCAVLAQAAMFALYRVANPLTALLAFVALAVYACVYTPMKAHSWWAAVVGAIPGAMPPLMGWTAVTGHLGAAGLSLFALMFFWQLPHFFAIALSLTDDYARGGLRVLPVVYGRRATVWAIVCSAAVLLPVTLLPAWAGVASTAYIAVALVVGGAFFAAACTGLRRRASPGWARGLFVGSVLHLLSLLLTLSIGAQAWAHTLP